MAVTVKKAVLWRKELENRPGTLAEALKPLADAGISLQVVMGYAYPGESRHAAVEVYPVSSAKAEKAAAEGGLRPDPNLGCLVVTGDDRAGLGHAVAEKLAQNGINISFVMAQSSGNHYHAVFGFETAQEADKAAGIIKDASKVVAMKGKGGGRSSARKAARPKAGAGKGAAKKAGAKKATAKKATARGGKKKPAGKAKAKKR